MLGVATAASASCLEDTVSRECRAVFDLDRDENVLLVPLRLHELLQKAASPVTERRGIQRDSRGRCSIRVFLRCLE